MTAELIVGGVLIPVTGWTLIRVVQHGEDIAALKEIARSVAESLDRISRHMEALDDRTFRQAERHPPITD